MIWLPSRFRRNGHLSAALLYVALASSAHALDFELHEYSFEEDKLTYHGTYFQKDAQTRVAITPPEGWNNVGDAAALTMIPPKPIGSIVRLEKSPVAPSTAFKDKGLDLYRQRVFVTIAPGATGVHLVEEHDNAFPIFNWHAYEFVVGYDFYGEAFQRSVIFVNINPAEQLVLTSVAPKEGYKQIRDAAMAVLNSWNVLPAK